MKEQRALLLRSMGRPGPRFYLTLGASAGALLWFLYAWGFQLRYGLVTTGLGDWGSGGGVPWGVYIGSYIWWIGIAHGGIIVSAAVRLFRIRALRPVARLAELVTLIALSMAALFILFHLGRPDRVVRSIVVAYPWTVFSSPLVWDVTVITLYFVLTATYILLTVRRDLYRVRDALPRPLTPLYRLLLVGYTPQEDEKVDRMAWWLAFAVILLAPLFLHGGVIPWLFAVLPSMPGWYGGIQGPTFLSIALTSALGAVLLVAYLCRRFYGWEEVIPDRVFRILGGGLAFFAMLFLWFQVQQVLTGVYAPPLEVERVWEKKLGTGAYWVSIGLVASAVLYLGAQVIWPSLFRVGRTVVVGLFPLLGTLIEKVLFVVEGLMEPRFGLYRAVPGLYWPSWIEVSALLASVALAVALFVLITKVIPVVEIHETEA